MGSEAWIGFMGGRLSLGKKRKEDEERPFECVGNWETTVKVHEQNDKFQTSHRQRRKGKGESCSLVGWSSALSSCNTRKCH